MLLTRVGSEAVSGGSGEAGTAQASRRRNRTLSKPLLATAIQLHVAAAHLPAHSAKVENRSRE